MIRWAGGLIVFYATAHVVGALTVEGAAHYAGTWLSGALWGEDLGQMSPAASAYWLSVNSFGPALLLVGLTVLWLDRRGMTAPAFIPWALIGWIAVNLVVAGPGIGQDLILLVAAGLLLAGARAQRPRSPGVRDRGRRLPTRALRRPSRKGPERGCAAADAG